MKIRVWSKHGLLPPTVSFLAEDFVFQDNYKAIRFITNISNLRRDDEIINCSSDADISSGDVVERVVEDRYGRTYGSQSDLYYITEVRGGTVRVDYLDHKVLIHRPFRDVEFYETMG